MHLCTALRSVCLRCIDNIIGKNRLYRTTSVNVRTVNAHLRTKRNCALGNRLKHRPSVSTVNTDRSNRFENTDGSPGYDWLWYIRTGSVPDCALSLAPRGYLGLTVSLSRISSIRYTLKAIVISANAYKIHKSRERVFV